MGKSKEEWLDLIETFAKRVKAGERCDGKVYTYEFYLKQIESQGMAGHEPISKEQWTTLVSLKGQADMVYTNHVPQGARNLDIALEGLKDLLTGKQEQDNE